MENTGALTATRSRLGASPGSYPCSLIDRPRITSTASFTIGTRVTFEMKGIVRLDRGFTSSTYTREVWPFLEADSALVRATGPETRFL